MNPRVGARNNVHTPGLVFYVASHSKRADAKFFHVMRGLFTAFLLARAQDQICTHFSQGLSHLAAQPNRSSRNNRDASFQIEKLFYALVGWLIGHWQSVSLKKISKQY